MNQNDSYYRALLDYRKVTDENRDCLLARKSVAHAVSDLDQIETTRYTCQVEEDWITAIEQGIPWIEKAIKEERQFITSQGEVVPIEKVKRISRESIVHLAQSSEMLYKNEDPEDTSINPKELYTIERYSDFSVYENRFLYMLLCYTQEFISMRYDKIMDFSTRYQGNLYLKKKVSRGGNLIDYEIKMQEVRKNDSYLLEKSTVKGIVERIFDLSMSVSALLKTPLMQEVAKAPMLKPPITKTNVLKMAINFKKSFELYDFLMAYSKDGFTIKEEKTVLSDFNEDGKADFAEFIQLMSFLSYEYGLDIRKELRASYDEENKRLQEEKKAELQQKVEDLRIRLQKKQVTPEEFILALEQRNRQLEADTKEIAPLRNSVEKLNESLANLTHENDVLANSIRELKLNVADLEEENKNNIEKVKNEYRQKSIELKDKYDEEKEAYRSGVFKELDAAKKSFLDEKTKFNMQAEEIKRKDAEVMGKFNSLKKTIEALDKDRKLLEKERDMATGQNVAYRQQLGIKSAFDEGELTKEEFEELERIYSVMEKYFNGKWKEVKKSIRKDILGSIRITLRKDPSEIDNDENLKAILSEKLEKNNKKKAPVVDNDDDDLEEIRGKKIDKMLDAIDDDDDDLAFIKETSVNISAPASTPTRANKYDAPAQASKPFPEVMFENKVATPKISKPQDVVSAFDNPSISDFDILGGKSGVEFDSGNQRDQLGARKMSDARMNIGKANEPKNIADDFDDIFGDGTIKNSEKDKITFNNDDDGQDDPFGFNQISKG